MKRIFSIFILLVHLTLSCLAANNSFWKPIGEDFDRLTLLADGWSRGERRDVNPRDILSRMQSVAALHPGDDVMQARTIYWRVCFGPGLEPAVADSLLGEALHLVGDRHPYDRARFMMQQAVILSKQADYADAYRLYMSAAAEFETVGDERLLGYTHYNISYIFLLLGEYAEAEANAVAADSLFARVHGDGLRLDAQMLLASIYERAGDSGKAYDILHEVSRLDSAGMSTAQRVVFLTTYLPYLSDPDSLFKYSDAAYRLAEVTGDSQLYLSSLLNKGWAFIDMGLPDSADHYARAARRLSYGMRTARGREGVYKLLASVNAARRDWDSAYHYQTLYYDTRENARGDGVLADVRTVNLKQEIEKIRINALIEQDKDATRSRAFLVVGLSLLGLLAASVYVICLLKRKMQAEQRRQMERDRQYIAQLNHEMQLVESKNRELSSNAMLLMKKNESLRKAIREMENINSFLKLSKRGVVIQGKTKIKIANQLYKIINETGVTRLTDFISLLHYITSESEYCPLSSTSFIHSFSQQELPRLQKIFDYILENFKNDITLKEVSEAANMSTTSLCKYFKSHTNRTLITFLNEIRIGHACKLLLERKDMSISEICFDCGFNNLTNFNIQFRKLKEMSPTSYRNTCNLRK